jgi:hypothetical protein
VASRIFDISMIPFGVRNFPALFDDARRSGIRCG